MLASKNYPHPIFAKEGWLFIILSVAIASLMLILAHWLIALPFVLIAVFIIQFFRDPARKIPTDANVILSPADGKIIAIETTYDEYQQQDALKISIFMNIFNVHSNRIPLSGTIIDIQYTAGKFFNADLAKSSIHNERNAIIILGENNLKITCVQVAGLIARRILCYVSCNTPVVRGQRYGFIRFGSRVDVYLPKTVTLQVILGQKIKAGRDILARIT
jgi:phosphatidylserine decarboxylase